MKWYRNAKIRTKLGVGYGLVITLILGLIATMLVITMMANGNFTYLETYPRTRRMALYDATIHFRSAQNYLSEMSTDYRLDEAYIDRLRQNILEHLEAALARTEQYSASINADPRYTPQELGAREADIAQISGLIESWRDNVAAPVTVALQTNRREEVFYLMAETSHISIQLLGALNNLKELTTSYINQSAAEVTAFAMRAVALLAIISVSTVLFLIFLMFAMTRILTWPLKELMKLASDVSLGKLNVNIDHSRISKDEIGMAT